MKKKVLALVTIACVACLSLVLVGCSSSNKSSDSNKFILGYDNTFKPFGYLDDSGNPTGFDIDLATEACQRLGWELELDAIDWDTKDAQIESGSITCIWNGFTMEGREDQYTFTAPYYSNTQVVVVKEGSGIATLNDLAGKKVLAQTNSSAYNLLANGGDKADLAATFASLETIGEYNSAFMQLESGAVDAIAMDMPVAQAHVAEKAGYVILDDHLSTESYAVGFKKGNTEQAKQIEDTLKAMYEDGTVAKIAEKYDLSMDNWILK